MKNLILIILSVLVLVGCANENGGECVRDDGISCDDYSIAYNTCVDSDRSDVISVNKTFLNNRIYYSYCCQDEYDIDRDDDYSELNCFII